MSSNDSNEVEDDSLVSKSHQVASLIIFTIVFIVLILYTVLQRYLCGFNETNSSDNNQVGRRIQHESNPDRRRRSSLQIQNHHGLELRVIPSLPMFQFKRSEYEGEGEGEEKKAVNKECAICLGEEFEEEEWVKKIPNCSHIFHVSCIDAWLQSHSNCPLCRTSVHHNLTLNIECSISSYTLPDTLRREDHHDTQERASHFQAIRGEILHNLAVRQQTATSN